MQRVQVYSRIVLLLHTSCHTKLYDMVESIFVRSPQLMSGSYYCQREGSELPCGFCVDWQPWQPNRERLHSVRSNAFLLPSHPRTTAVRATAETMRVTRLGHT